VRRYVRAWRNCAKRGLRKAHLTGTLATNSRDCSTKPAAQIASAAKRRRLRRRMTIASATLDRAGFAAVATFLCGIGRSGDALLQALLGRAVDHWAHLMLSVISAV